MPIVVVVVVGVEIRCTCCFPNDTLSLNSTLRLQQKLMRLQQKQKQEQQPMPPQDPEPESLPQLCHTNDWSIQVYMLLEFRKRAKSLQENMCCSCHVLLGEGHVEPVVSFGGAGLQMKHALTCLFGEHCVYQARAALCHRQPSFLNASLLYTSYSHPNLFLNHALSTPLLVLMWNSGYYSTKISIHKGS